MVTANLGAIVTADLEVTETVNPEEMVAAGCDIGKKIT